jgi:hypothetical protein
MNVIRLLWCVFDTLDSAFTRPLSLIQTLTLKLDWRTLQVALIDPGHKKAKAFD